MILVTGASGMFGGGIAAHLAAQGVAVRGLVRREDAARELDAKGVQPVLGDMDDPATLAVPMRDVDTVFLVSPMDDRIAVRERNLLDAAQAAGATRIVKLYGAVKHRGDALDQLHTASIEAIRASGLDWALLSPNSVMETSLLSQVDGIRAGAIWASAGDGRVGLVAAADVARAGAVVLTQPEERGRNYEITGPQAVTLGEVAETLTRVLGRPIAYNDLPEDAFRDVLVQSVGMTPEQAELGVLVHYRAWKRGDADLVTDTYRELTGTEPTSLEAWVREHVGAFAPEAG